MRALLLIGLASCALTSKAKPVEVRYFAPATPEAKVQAPSPGRARLGRVTASSHLRYRIVHRRSPVELELSDELRWTEQPEEYVRRAVEQALFVERGLEQATSGDAPTLLLEVTAFDDVERAGRHYGSVQIHYQLEDGDRVIADDVITVERPASSADITRVVDAIGLALQAASIEVAERVIACVHDELARNTSRQSGGSPP